MTTTYITRKEYAKQMRNAMENMIITTEMNNTAAQVIETVKRVISKGGKDLMNLQDTFKGYIDSTFGAGKKDNFILDKDEMNEIYNSLQEKNIHAPKRALEKAKAEMSQGRIIANNIIREADNEYKKLFKKVNEPSDYFRFMVEVEEAKNERIDTFHEEAAVLFDKADDYMKFVYGLICIEDYGKKRKLHQPKLKKCKGMIVDWEENQIKYELFFDTPFKVVSVEGVVKTKTIDHQ
ncbi:hypothetical protein [Bacillus sp. RC51]|uniref:hypothetical protein n=1 Tax=Bacillus sp. RC51 TaxID=3156288 RepID=UPI00383585D9